MELLIGILTGLVIAFIGWKTYEMNKGSKNTDSGSAPGGGFGSGGAGEVPKDFKK